MKPTIFIIFLLSSILASISCENPLEVIKNRSIGKILFTSIDSVDYEIYSIETHGESLEKLTDNDAFDILPLISPNKDLILFSSGREQDQELYLMSINGENQRRLKDRISGISDSYSWSSNGHFIIFLDGESGAETEIYTINVDGSNLNKLTDNHHLDASPVVSPDNSTIAFSSWFSEKKTDELYVMDINGNNKRCLTDFETNRGLRIKWSPDGRKIAFFIYLASEGWNLYVIDKDGSNLKKVYDMSTMVDWFPIHFEWFPDSKSILFCKGVDNVPSDSKIDIYKINIDGSGLVNLTNNEFKNTSPKFSPDGNYIVFVSDKDGDKDIYYMDVDGQNIYNISNNDVEDDFPSWILSY